ncbi:serine hydrolase domain-containing protein [Brevibacillus choshinensis]|uniref:serine hydrolase domain-containing protein n=1 Tax=Brevibacillus choshinensis TaxID=54911 RepID=UPI002E1B492C|nr:serine hydrolase [Brevibacillus choshinensis]
MSTESPQAQVQQWLDEWSASREGCGLQVAAYLRGEQVLNACSGTADPFSKTPVTEDTLFIAQSCTKGVTATVIHLLVQQGKLSYDDKVAQYWPEFAANGKDSIMIRHVLCHTAGIPLMPDHSDMALICDWNSMIREIEQLTPIWEPGSKSGYHGLTFGWILGETAARADGRPFARIVQEEICKPLGIENELYFGAPPEAESRIAKISGKELPIALLPDDHLMKKVLPLRVVPIRNPEWNEPMFHQAVIPAVNGILTANALARMYASLIGDGVDGMRILNPTHLQEATHMQVDQRDEIMQVKTSLSLGYVLGNAENADAMRGKPHAFGYTGIGGMIGFADPVNEFTFAILTNRMTNARDAQAADTWFANKVRELLHLQ